MPEWTSDLIAIALTLTFVWFLWGSLASGEYLGRNSAAQGSERSHGRTQAVTPLSKVQRTDGVNRA